MTEPRPHPGPFTKLSFNAPDRTMTALKTLTDATGLNNTDCINRGIQMYAYLEKLRQDGDEFLIRTGNLTRPFAWADPVIATYPTPQQTPPSDTP